MGNKKNNTTRKTRELHTKKMKKEAMEIIVPTINQE